MQYKNSLLFIGLVAISAATAQEFDNNDVPSQCRTVCQSMVDAARTCDQNFDGDREEVNCICSTNGASTQLPECAACIRQFDDSDDDQNDVDEVVSSCGFSSTTYNAGAAATGSASNSGTITSSSSVSLITSVYTTTSTDFDDDPNDQDETETRTRTTVFAADATQSGASSTSQSSGGVVDSATSSVGSGIAAATSNAGNAGSSATSAAGDAISDSGAAATALPMLGAGALAAVLGLL